MNPHTTQIIGLGQSSAGDDAAGLEVIKYLQGHKLNNAQLTATRDPATILDLLQDNNHKGDPFIIVDAIINAGRPGAVITITEHQIDIGPRALSSHAMSLRDTIALARTLGAHPGPITLVGITIDTPKRPSIHLSRAITQAIPKAADQVLQLINGPT